MKLAEFVSADPFMESGGWRQELVAGERRTLSPRGEAFVERAMALARAVAAAVKRAKVAARITMGAGLGIERPEGDEFRVADIILALPGERGRHRPAAVFLIVGAIERLSDDEQSRLAVFMASGAVREIALFAAAEPRCRYWRRFADGWSECIVAADQRALSLACVPASIFLAAIYPEAEAEDGTPQ